jgi:hypothetical protein
MIHKDRIKLLLSDYCFLAYKAFNLYTTQICRLTVYYENHWTQQNTNVDHFQFLSRISLVGTEENHGDVQPRAQLCYLPIHLGDCQIGISCINTVPNRSPKWVLPSGLA